MRSFTEENYLKTIYQLSGPDEIAVSTNALAEKLETSAPSVTDMLRRMAGKRLLIHQKYRGVTLTRPGKEIAVQILRRHRIWEVFLVDQLGYKWDEVHEIAEQLEHVQSDDLIERLHTFLGHPQFDPHGDPIPDQEGNFPDSPDALLADLRVGQQAIIVGVREHSPEFLRFLEGAQLVLGTEVNVVERLDFDHSMRVNANKSSMTLSGRICRNLIVQIKST
jgi:DtxR family Mn-dependent transcriptional regulator